MVADRAPLVGAAHGESLVVARPAASHRAAPADVSPGADGWPIPRHLAGCATAGRSRRVAWLSNLIWCAELETLADG